MADDARTTSGWGKLIPAATFIVGLVIGGLVILLTHTGDDGSSATPAPSPSASKTAGDTVVTVPAACQEASTNLEKATGLLRDGVGSVKNFDPQQLITLLNQLEDLDQKTRPLVQECSAVTVTTGASPTPSLPPSVTPSPTS